MRIGTLWRAAVLTSLTLLASGQLCMLTTCVPRLTPHHASPHACCRAWPSGQAPARTPGATGTMPCGLAMHAAGAPSIASPRSSDSPSAVAPSAEASLVAAAPRGSAPRAPLETGPSLHRHRSAPAGLRAPPQA